VGFRPDGNQADDLTLIPVLPYHGVAAVHPGCPPLDDSRRCQGKDRGHFRVQGDQLTHESQQGHQRRTGIELTAITTWVITTWVITTWVITIWVITTWSSQVSYNFRRQAALVDEVDAQTREDAHTLNLIGQVVEQLIPFQGGEGERVDSLKGRPGPDESPVLLGGESKSGSAEESVMAIAAVVG